MSGSIPRYAALSESTCTDAMLLASAEIAGRIEPRVRVATLLPAELPEVRERIGAGRRHVGIGEQVVLRVEAAHDVVVDRRRDRSAFRPSRESKIVR